MSEQAHTPPQDSYEVPDLSTHALPPWVNWLQDNVFLSALLLAEAYLLGNIMALGWVPSVANFATWDLFHGIGAGLFFAAGACGAGVALSCSLRSAAAFQRNEWGFAVGNLFGLLMFSIVEIWASIAERSANLPPTPADDAVLHWLGVPNAPISPTVVMIAVFFPFVTLFYGFSRLKRAPKPVEDPATLRARLENERIQAEHNAEMRKIGAAGVRGAAGALFGGNAATQTPPQEVITSPYQDTPTSEMPAISTNAAPQTTNPSRPRPGSPAYKKWVRKAIGRIESQLLTPTVKMVADALGESEADVAPVFNEIMRERHAATR